MFLRALFSLFFIFSQTVNGFELDWELIHYKLQQPMPSWMIEQIQEDLQPFEEINLTEALIDQTINSVRSVPSGSLSQFVKYTLKNNQVSFQTIEATNDPRITFVVEALNEIISHLPLPDLVFLASLWDYYDNPLFLEKTDCPVFAICKKNGNKKAVLYPEFRHFDYRKRLYSDIDWISGVIDWKNKIPVAFWRGMSSGGHYAIDTWDQMPRSRLVLLSQQYPELVDAAFTTPYSLYEPVKTIMESYGMFKTWGYPTDFVKYNYLISIDGNSFASNLWWQLLSNCCVLKTDSPFIEWFYKGIERNVHYIPFSLNCCDLKEKIEWLHSNEEIALKIAEKSRTFAKEQLTNEDLIIYFYQLLQAYSKLYQGENE